jgi:hypothetical protein
MLSDAGYCVFALNYGANSWTAYTANHVYALDFDEHSAAQLADFVQNVVLPDTGASAVDIVGHSQGGMMPRYYIEHRWDCSSVATNGFGERQCAQADADTAKPTGASHVHTLVGLAPANHGGDLGGLMPLMISIFGSSAWTFPEYGCGACGEQEPGNPFMTALNGADGSREATPGILHYVIETGLDELVTPAPGPVQQARGEWPSAYLHGSPDLVLNLRVQDQCTNDTTEHIGIVYDPVAVQDVANALANNASPGSTPLTLAAPSCPVVPVPPLISG